MEFQQIVRACRSYRRFDESVPVGGQTLRDLVALARMTPSALNKQPLKYFLSSDAGMNARIFPTLAWAGYLTDWPGPPAGERPAAYIVVLLDTTISQAADTDAGIVAQTILLGAVQAGLGGCMIANVRRQELAAVLGLPDHLKIVMAIALGRPVEKVTLEDLPAGGSVKYYRDAGAGHHVPKRALDELIHGMAGS
jgi:nitroreductase